MQSTCFYFSGLNLCLCPHIFQNVKVFFCCLVNDNSIWFLASLFSSPHCNKYQNLISFHGHIIFHCMNVSHFVWPFIHRKTFGLFPFGGYYEWCCCENVYANFCVAYISIPLSIDLRMGFHPALHAKNYHIYTIILLLNLTMGFRLWGCTESDTTDAT